MTDLMGKTAVITGASRGIGAATAREFARKGARLVLVARDHSQLLSLQNEIHQMQREAKIMTCDVSRYEDVEKAIKLCLSSYGQLDILVNNAGLIDPISHLCTSDPQKWTTAADVNYKGVYFGLRCALPHMLKQRKGVVINISSGAATSALEGWSHYCSSKAAALSLTRCAHKEVGDKGINVIGLSPGTVATHMQRTIKKSGINPVSQLDPSVHLSPDVVARAIAWLCTEEATPYSGTDYALKDDKNLHRFLE